MSTVPGCGNCDRPVQDGAQLCLTCADGLMTQLWAVPDLIENLFITYAKQDKLGSPGGQRGKLAEAPLPVRFDITRVIDSLSNTMTTWARVLVDHHGWDVPNPPRRRPHNGLRGVVIPASSPSVDLACFAAEWLAEHVGHLRQHPAAMEAHTQLTAAIRWAQDAVDYPDERTRFPVGPCPETDVHDEYCKGEVWAHFPIRLTDPAELRCRVCGTKWDTTRWHRTGARIAARRRQLSQEVS